MDTAQSFHRPPSEPVDLATATAAPDGSFWTGAPKLLAGLGTIIGSIVALTTVLVQAGVIGSSTETPQTVPTMPAQTAPVVPTVATPSLVRALGDLNGLLAESARTKGNLGRLIADVQTDPPSLDRSGALRAIQDIIEQREQLHSQLAAFDAPSPLSKALALLRDSITASLADDRLVRQWIVARYDADGAADQLWQAQREASSAASHAKSAFRAEYEDRLVSTGLSSFIPDY